MTRARVALSALLLSLASLLVLAGACSEGGAEESPLDLADAAAGRCASRADCEALGAGHAGLVCGASGRCEPCASDGQCRLREACDPETARCAFREGYGDACTFNDECLAGEFCVQGLCRPALEVTLCVEGRCLAAGQRCSALNGVCEADLGCFEDGDCAEGELCNLPTASCVTRCTAESAQYLCLPGERCLGDRCSACAADGDCAAGMTCDTDALVCALDDGGAVRCARDRDCAASQVCDPDLGICVAPKPACTSDESCASGERCELSSGKCLARACQPDRFEPNDTFAAACAAGRDLSAGSFAGLTLCGGSDLDFHTITLARGELVSASLDADALLDGRVAVAIIDPLERVLGEGSLAASGVAVMAGRHAIRVTSGEAWVDYGLTLALGSGTPCDFDAFEPNDSAASATPIDAAGSFAGLTICGGDVDVFRVAVPEGRRARVQAEVTGGGAALDVEALASDVAGAGERLFRVSSPLRRARVTYTLTVSF